MAKTATETIGNIKAIMKVLKPIMFEAEIVEFAKYVKKIKRLPFDRQYAIFTYPEGREDKDGNAFLPECPYIGGEKYVIVQNAEVLNPLVEVLSQKIKNMKVNVSNIDNELFRVNFYSVAPDKRTNDYYAPVISFVNSYNGKIQASAKAGLYRIDKKGNEMFLNNGSIQYRFKHHSDENVFAINKIAENVDLMLSEFDTINSKIEKLKKHEVPMSGLSELMLKLVPNSKEYPKKAISLAVEHVGYEAMLFDTTPNLWLVYTALAHAVKSLDSKMGDTERETADAIAWANVINHANIK